MLSAITESRGFDSNPTLTASSSPYATPSPEILEWKKRYAFRCVHKFDRADLAGCVGSLAACRGNRMGHCLRDGPLHAEYQGSRGRGARIVEHTLRSCCSGATHKGRH